MEFQAEKSLWHLVYRGIIPENTIFRMAISLCPAIAVTSSIANALLMGIAVLFVQIMVNVTISLLRSMIHQRARLPVFMLTTAVWVTVADQLLAAYAALVYSQVALYIQLIVAFASILSGAEVFASKNGPIASLFDGAGRGLGFLGALVIIGAFREFLGFGSLLGHKFFADAPLAIISMPVGGFLTVGFLMAGFNALGYRTRTSAVSCPEKQAGCKACTTNL